MQARGLTGVGGVRTYVVIGFLGLALAVTPGALAGPMGGGGAGGSGGGGGGSSGRHGNNDNKPKEKPKRNQQTPVEPAAAREKLATAL